MKKLFAKNKKLQPEQGCSFLFLATSLFGIFYFGAVIKKIKFDKQVKYVILDRYWIFDNLKFF